MRLVTALFLLLFIACKSVSITPTPFLIDDLTERHTAAVEQYVACSEGANYVPEKEGCNPEKLETSIRDTMSFAKEFISADIQQAAGYDVYLYQSLILFRIANQITGNEYTEAEKIARQFFEIQKASSSKRDLTDARYYWAAVATEYASWQWLTDRLALDAIRKAELLLCHAEGNVAFHEIEPGTRKIRLRQYLKVLKSITDSI